MTKLMQGDHNMRNRIILTLSIAASFISAPAQANEARAELRLGYADVKLTDSALGIAESDSGVTYGVAAGYDLSLGKSAFIGLEASFDLTNSKLQIGATELKAGRQISLTARLGAKIGEHAGIYLLAGRANTSISANGISDKGTGNVFGGGLQYNIGSKAFFKSEYRRVSTKIDINNNNTGRLKDQRLLAGFGVRF
jgi:outer membrane immunogenic protein